MKQLLVSAILHRTSHTESDKTDHNINTLVNTVKLSANHK